MGALLEELARREAAARERVERLRERLAAEEEALSRLVITRETVEEIVGEAAQPAEQPASGSGGADGMSGQGRAGDADTGVSPSGGSPIGVVTVPRWRPDVDASVLPRTYQDVLEVLVDAGGAMRAGKIVAALGLPAEAAKVESMRAKLKRMVERGWLAEDAPGMFAVTGQVVDRTAR
jgi:hypothetical protein